MPTRYARIRDAGKRSSRLAVAVCLAMAATFIGSLTALGVALYDRSASDARSMAVALQQYALRTVTTGELAADTVAEAIRTRGGMAGLVDDRALHDLLAGLSARLPDGAGLLVVDAQGKVVSSYAEFPARPIDLSDREWFIAQRKTGADFLLSEALLGRLTQRKMFILTKSVRIGGQLQAVVNLGLPSDALIGDQALPIYADGVVLSLMKPDGAILARSDFPDSLLGTKLSVRDGAEDALHVLRARDVDHRPAIEATDSEPRYGLVARASIPLVQAFGPLLVLSGIGLPLVIAMMVATFRLIRSVAAQNRALGETTARLRVVLDAAHLGTWHLDVASGASDMNERWARIVGHEPGEVPNSSEEWASRLHPDERETVLAALDDMLAGRTPLMNIEHRLRHKDGHWVWVLDSGCVVERDAAGHAVTATGTLLDISERRETERRIGMLMGEVDHRSKNLLAVVQSLVNLMPAEDVATFKTTLQGRIKALGHVHSLLSEAGWQGVGIDRLIGTETMPYQSDQPPRIWRKGPEVTLRPAAAQALAMVVHELMTNSAKYGALSAATGEVGIDWHMTGADAEKPAALHLRWQESGGPAVTPPQRQGFGARLLGALVREQMEGTLEQDWPASGAVIRLTLPLAAILPVGTRGFDPRR